MKSIRYRFLIAALAVMLGSALANSQTADAAPPPPMHGGMEHGRMGMDGHILGFYAKALGITDDQKTQMKAVLHKEHATMKPLMTQIHQLDQELKQYEEGTYDAAKVQTLVATQAQTLVQLKVNESRIHNELYSMLTSDQQAKLKEIEAKHEARMQERMNAAPTAAPEE
jgi:Spy/CpxP family protein refolding chaperone